MDRNLFKSTILTFSHGIITGKAEKKADRRSIQGLQEEKAVRVRQRAFFHKTRQEKDADHQDNGCQQKIKVIEWRHCEFI